MATTTNSNSTSPTPLISYNSRDFAALKNDLVSYVQTYHADALGYLNDSSPDMMYMELLAFVGDGLNYNTDKAFNEAFRLSAQSRESLVRIANDLGFYNFYPKPSSTQLVLSINVPATPNSDGSAMIPDPQYLFGVHPLMSFQSDNGTNFECLTEVNFYQDLNRTIVPNLDSNGKLIDFTVSKSIAVYAGQTKVQRFYVSQTTAKPFLEVLVDDPEASQIISVLAVAGNTFDVPSDETFRSSSNLYLEVENLAQDQVFYPINPTQQDAQNIINAYTDMTINYGQWVNQPQRFIVRRDKNNQTSLIFGSTLVDFTTWNQVIGGYDVTQLANFSLNQILNNKALGSVPPIDSTLFIKFRSGAGLKTNVLTNSITSIVGKQVFTASTPGNLTVFDQVVSSLKVTSSLPALGGTNALSNEEIRQSTGKIFAANDRAVTYEDVKAIVQKMPTEFGQPFRVSYEEIKPILLSYQQVKNYVSAQLDSLLLAPTSTERQLISQTIKTWLTAYPTQTAFTNSQTNTSFTLGEVSDSTNSDSNTAEHGLWYGEKSRLYVLGLNSDLQPVTSYKDVNGLWQDPLLGLKTNIQAYLKTKRVIGDWIDIVNANVVDFQVTFKIIADNKNKQSVLIDCLTALRNYFATPNWQINQPIFVGNVQTILQGVQGVINVVEIKFINVFGIDLTTGLQYSPVEIGRYKYLLPTSLSSQNNKYEMQNFDNVIMSFPDVFLNLRFPESDIIGSTIN